MSGIVFSSCVVFWFPNVGFDFPHDRLLAVPTDQNWFLWLSVPTCWRTSNVLQCVLPDNISSQVHCTRCLMLYGRHSFDVRDLAIEDDAGTRKLFGNFVYPLIWILYSFFLFLFVWSMVIDLLVMLDSYDLHTPTDNDRSW